MEQVPEGLAGRLRAARVEAGVTLAAMAGRTHYSKALLGHLETGARAIRPEHVTAYSRVLGVSVERLHGPADDALRIAHEWLVADTPMRVQLRAGRRVGDALATELERRIVELRHLDDVVGGNDLFPIVARELREARTLVRESCCTETTRRRLLTGVGELSQLAGWVASDAGRHAEAQRVYLSGTTAAAEAGDRALAGQLLSSLSYQVATVGDPADAVLLARTAVAGTRTAPPVVRALLRERVAWATARARDRDGARRALDAADDAFEQRSPGVAEPEWVYWLDRSEIDVMAARCMIELGDPRSAAPLLDAAIDGYPPEHAREVALYLTWLAESYLGTGTLDAGREALDRARRAAQGVHSARLDARIAAVQQLAGPRPG
ncbi:helix-turn-helix transcriptional regulator [Pseudonocardia sp. NPDC046786]|uniref:helix-turn-helix transcriptional regulator n=1 Tax=Pseudonocardia sp. NPDC046786 TaxID=3155471 RepID=UPI003402D736